jgi:hypothetical protein
MKILRSVTRRGFTVGTAGWFNILGQPRWFAATRFPGPSRHHFGLSKAAQAPDQQALGHAGIPATVIPPRISLLSTRDRGWMRPALVVLAAIASAWLLLWMLFHP